MAIIKHANPCGIAVSSISVADAHRKAHECDPLSAFGGVIAANTAVTEEMAETVADIFTEVIVAPAFEPGAVEILSRKKNIRILVASEPQPGGTEFRQVSGGLLVQTRDEFTAEGDNPVNWTLATGDPADPKTLADLVFAWRACRAVKSNAIVIAADGATVGVGMGQVNRVDAARLAVERAGDRVSGAVAASDAFFPFPDGLETLTSAGVRAIVHPGGSVRDDEVTAAAAENTTFIEVSAHPILTHAMGETLEPLGHHHTIGTLWRDGDDTVRFHTSLNATHTNRPPDTPHLPEPHPALPSTPWLHDRHWVEVTRAGRTAGPAQPRGAWTDQDDVVIMPIRAFQRRIAGNPVAHHDPAARLCDPHHFLGHVEGPGRKHRSKNADDKIEAVISDPGKIGRIALLKPHVRQAELPCAQVACGHQVAGDIDAQYIGPAFRRRNRGRSIAASQVQNLHALHNSEFCD